MEDGRTRVARVLHELRELGVSELFLDTLTAEEAGRLLGGGAPAVARAARPSAGRTAGPSTPPSRARTSAPTPEAFPGPPDEASEAASSAGTTAGRGTAPRQGSRTRPRTGADAGDGSALRMLEGEATGCVKCRLSESRTQVVFGRGAATARLVVVGEAPGSEEDRTGLPFVGPAGKLLDLLLLSVGFDRDSVYICNVLKCRPPRNRDPQADEVATCSPYLHGQLDAVQPAVLLAVGKFAAQTLTGTEDSIGRLRGRVHEYRGIPVVATYHPAYLLRSPEATRKTWQDLQLMRQVMDEHG